MTEKSKIIGFTPREYGGILIAATIIGCMLRLAQHFMPGLELFLVGYGFAVASARFLYRK